MLKLSLQIVYIYIAYIYGKCCYTVLHFEELKLHIAYIDFFCRKVMHGFVCEGEGGCGGGGEAMNRLNAALLQSQRMNQ